MAIVTSGATIISVRAGRAESRQTTDNTKRLVDLDSEDSETLWRVIFIALLCSHGQQSTKARYSLHRRLETLFDLPNGLLHGPWPEKFYPSTKVDFFTGVHK